MEVPCCSLCLEVEVMSKVPGSFLAVGLGFGERDSDEEVAL
jgi:hypothetical protein